MKLLESNFSRRLVVTVLGIPLILAIIIGGPIPLYLFINLIVLISLFEIKKLLDNVNLKLSPYLFVPLTIGIIYFMTNGEAYLRNSIFITSVIFVGIAAAVLTDKLFSIQQRKLKNRLQNKVVGVYPGIKNFLVTVSATLIMSVFLSYAILLKQLPLGTELLTTTIFGVFAFDTGAYVFGTIFGKNKMAPSISPGKTWEGAFAGTIISVSTVLACSSILGVGLNILIVVMLGIIVVLLGQTGDLLESYFKRKMKSKDSSRLLPGHGGVLDRIDSIVIVLPAVYYWLLLWV
ncbi:MAG: phosphatidate cytidylyltransferase [Chloroflexota bacterium]|nr:phosphatidate cytidylyltransferase [Chloroflexota bacterium]